MDKRSSPRYAISLDALVHPARGRSWLCSIKDFCTAGMLLTEQESTRVRRTAPVGVPGEKVGIHFSLPTAQGEEHIRLEGRIVRVEQEGLGISFSEGIDADVMTQLLEYSKQSPLARSARKAGPAKAAPARKKPGVSQEKLTEEKTAVKSRTPASQTDPGITRRNGRVSPDLTDSSAQSGRGNLDLNGIPMFPSKKRSEAEASSRPVSKTRQSQDSEKPTAAKAIEPAGDISVADAQHIIAECRKRTVKILAETNSVFFSYMDKELLRLAGAASNNALQSEYFAAMATLVKHKQQIDQKITREVLDQIDNPRAVDDVLSNRQVLESERRQEHESRRIRISLVNADEFEDWLSVANIISHSETYFERYLVAIQSRLGMLVDSWAHNEVNPFCPEVLTRAFDDAFRHIGFTKEVREKIYIAYETEAVPLFRHYYISITKLLEDSGLFPDLDEHYFTSGPIKIPDVTSQAETQQTPEAEDFEEEAEPEQYLLDDELAGPRQPVRRHPHPGFQPLRDARRGERRSTVGDMGSVLRNLYSTVRTLIHPEDRFDSASEEDQFTLEEVQKVLAELQSLSKVGTNRLPIREQIHLRMEQQGSSGHLSPMDSQNLEVVENLVADIKQDSLVSNSAKNWIRQLEITLGRVATENPDFLDVDHPHAAVEVINQLALLGASGSGSIRRNVDNVVQRIVENYDGRADTFGVAIKDLAPLVERQARAFKGNVRRAATVSEGQQTLINSQRAVIEELDRRFSGRQVPEILLKLLMPGWRNLLVNTHLRQGEKSADWRRNLHVLEQLFLHLDKNADPTQSQAYMEPELLLQQIEAGLNAIAYEPGQRAPLMSALKEILAEGADISGIKRIGMPKEGMADSLGLGGIKEKEKSRAEIRRQYESDPEWATWYDRTTNLFVGEWLEFVSKSRDAEVAIVAWVSDQRDKFVFVNRRGVQIHERSVEELTSMLLLGRARIIAESDIPLTDRASRRMLQNMHNQLTHRATHDELTGLANRKEFELQVDRSLKQVKKAGGTDLVACLNLDQFKVINNISGHDAGDRVLESIAELLTANVTDDSCLLARLGGDEFGILLAGFTETKTMALLENVLDEIRAFRFELGGAQYSLTTSIGCVVVDDQTDSVLHIMRAADSACSAAKDAGRDRIQLFEQGDDDLVRRTDIMAFVAQIDQALENDRFILNCQKIAPIDETEGALPHYEILLTVLNAKGEALPPQDFIVAAETYNRMGAIDRWVIKNSFKWIADNLDQLDNLDAFSINISGNSLNDDDFMDFVLEQFNATGLPTSKICFEITETAAVNSLDGTIEFMQKMKVIGCEFSLDDFGTGLSSYSYLRNLPVDYLKIDGIFVKDIVASDNDYAVVKSINEIGHFMGMKTIAEFVENDEILELLRELGVDYAQGYGIGKKIPLDQLL